MQGFLKAYDSVRAKVMVVSDEVMGGEPRSWQASVTGHSLGGALATLCSYELANRRCGRQSVTYGVCCARSELPSLRHWVGALRHNSLAVRCMCADVTSGALYSSWLVAEWE